MAALEVLLLAFFLIFLVIVIVHMDRTWRSKNESKRTKTPKSIKGDDQ